MLLRDRSILWLSGVRRVGKTTLCKSYPNIRYFDCELPRVRSELEDPERFFRLSQHKIIVLDEIHRLSNPSEVLKICADHFPEIKLIATGSSTLAAKSKFRDTLTGRKRELWLLPSIAVDQKTFGVDKLDDRMLKGGLPSMLLAPTTRDSEFIEWMDSFWAKDVQELFIVERRHSFMKFIELLFKQNGGLFEAQAFTTPCEISRQTVMNYLSILETTLLFSVIRPFHNGSATEIKMQPKIYGFDTGFVSFYQGIESIDSESRGHLFENLVLLELQSVLSKSEIFYWRNKQKHEIDFVVKNGRSRKIYAIECKSKANQFDASSLAIFRKLYPLGSNIVVCLDRSIPEKRVVSGLEVIFCGYHELSDLLFSMLDENDATS